MKIKEVFFIIGIFAIGIKAANLYNPVDLKIDEIASDEVDLKVKLEEDTFIDDQKLLMNYKLTLLELQNKALFNKFNDLEENNKKLQEKLDERINRQRETSSQKSHRLQLEASSEILIIRLKKCVAFLILFHYFYKAM